MISYRRNHQKILEGLVWLAQKAPELDHYWMVKIIFEADKLHLNRYGRPIFGDRYVAMKYGPVPSHALNIINGELTDAGERTTADAALEVRNAGMGKRLRAKRGPDLRLFSRTDLACLEESLAKYRGYSFGRLVEETHREPAWQAAWNARGQKEANPMDYLLLVDDSPAKKEIQEQVAAAAGAVF